jgi:cytochrome c553
MLERISKRLLPTLAAVLVWVAGLRPCAGADVALGEYLSAQCVICHQLSGSVAGGIPAIVGLPEQTFVEALEAYKTGKRDNSVMRNVAARLSQDDMAALAAYFAARKR